MNDKTRKIIGTLSILFIIGLYAYKGLPNFAGKGIVDILPMLFTSLAVTGIKVGIIYGVIVIGKNVVNKLKSNGEEKQNNRDSFKIKNNNVKIKEKEIEHCNIINGKQIINTGTEVLDKPKTLIKRK